MVKKQAQVHSIRNLLQVWMQGTSYRSQFGYTMLGIISFSLWEIWKQRCKLRFEGSTRESRAVICATLHHLREANMVSQPKRIPTRMDRILLETLGVQIQEPVFRRGRWVAWIKPGSNVYKLNTDGPRKGNAATRGGVLRDSEGDFILGFTTRFKHSDALRAELDAIHLGLQICASKHLWHTVIETNSTMARNMILHRSTVAWEYEYTIRRIRRLLIKFEGLQLTMRETNKVGDAFAKCGYMIHGMVECNNLNEAPMYIRKLLFIDRIGLPYFRSRCN